MISKSREHVKTAILVVLIILSVLQLGILWNYQSHGLPINLLGIFSPRNPSTAADFDELAREAFFNPFRVIAYSGIKQEQIVWLLSKDDDFYDELWDEGREYLLTAMKSSRIEKLDANRWNELIKNKAFVFEMASPLPSDLVRYFLDISEENKNGIETVHKLMLSLEESPRDVTVYILGDNLYRLSSTSASAGGMSRNDYDRIYTSLINSETALQYRLFGLTADLVEGIRPDVLASLTNDRKSFEMYRQSIPVGELSNTELMRNLLLDRHRESFDIIRNGDIAVFKTLDNTYRIDPMNGVVEFSYNPGSGEQPRGNVGDVFRNVFKRINSIKSELLPDNELYLHSVELNGPGEPDSYVFNIGCMAGDYPVFYAGGDDTEAAGAVGGGDTEAAGAVDSGDAEAARAVDSGDVVFPLEIRANSQNVISFRWNIRQIFKSNIKKDYDINFLNIMQNIFSTYEIDASELEINDAIECFVRGLDDGSDLFPSLILDTGDEMLSIPLTESEE
ncbi:MAG: two-component system activity regulator YycH [Eubacteriales bacterium]|nr:two-component system activity regulator YycH [Eubacteriales bacterium]